MPRLIAVIILSGLSMAVFAADDAIVAKYDQSCVSCHAQGIAGAPKAFDPAAWKPLLAKGMGALLTSVNNGINAMPPKGMCYDCTERDFRQLIEYMSHARDKGH